MANESIAQIKTYFETLDRPTQTQYISLIDTLSQKLYDNNRAYISGESIIIDNSGIKAYLCNSDTAAGESPINTPGKWGLVDGGVNIQRNLTFSETLDFSKDLNYYDRGTQSGAIAFTEGVAPVKSNVYVYTDFTADGSAITFPASWKAIKNEYISDNSVYGLTVYWDGVNHQYQLYKIYTPDVTAPTLTSATIENSTDSILDLVFDEAVNITITGFTINTDGAGLSISSVLSGSGTTTPKFQLSRSILSTETLTLDYSSVTGDTEDLSGNILASFIGQPVTNNVVLVENDLNFITYSQNMTKTGTVYEVAPADTYGYLISDETFSGDFEAIIDLTDAYGIIGRQLSFGINISSDTTYSTGSGWQYSLFFASPTGVQFFIGATADGSAVIAQNDRIKIRRVGSTVTVEKYTGGSWTTIKTATGSYSDTVRINFTGYGDGTGRAKVYNPKYL